MRHLITTFWTDGHKQRTAEIELCREINRGVFDEIFVLAENAIEPDDCGCRWHNLSVTPNYSDLLDYSRHCMPRDLVVIANSDVFFTERSLEIAEHNIEHDEVYALSRWDVATKFGVKLFDVAWSQDAWMFRGAPKRAAIGGYEVNRPGCDNRFCSELHEIGYTVLNPSLSVKVFHLHATKHRPTSNNPARRVPGPYLHVKPSVLGERPVYLYPWKISKAGSAFQA